MHTKPVIRTVCPLGGDLLPKGKKNKIWVYVSICVYAYIVLNISV